MNYRLLLISLALVMVPPLTGVSFGQQTCPGSCESFSVSWQAKEDDKSSLISGVQSYPLDSLSVVAHRLLQNLQQDGYYEATIQAVDTAVTSEGKRITFQVHRGPRALIDRLDISGLTAVDSVDAVDLIDTKSGQVPSGERLEADIDRLLRHYEEIGYPLAQIEVRRFRLHGDPRRVAIELHVTEGPAIRLAGINLPGAQRVRQAFVEQLLDLSPGQRLKGYDPEWIRRQLLDTGLFAAVGEPQLVTTGDQEAVLQIPVDERPPGQFDMVLGYKPPSGQTGGQLIGNGFIDLQNLFGSGRQFRFEMDRMSGQVSEMSVGIDLPFTGGLPLRTGLRFEGYQQDSTYGTRTLDAEVGYRMNGGLELVLAGRWKTTRPGVHGVNRSISRSSVWAGGLGIRYRQIDQRINPRKGWLLELSMNHGRKQRGDTVSVIIQQRLEGRLRTFWPMFDRQVFVAGSDLWLIRSPVYDETDLYRIGGTRTLRGYEEDQFLARLAARGLVEYRLQIDRRSYGFVFADLGYLSRPGYGSIDPTQWWRWGYGAGAQVETNIGLVQLSYALTPRASAAGGRLHIGMSFAL